MKTVGTESLVWVGNVSFGWERQFRIGTLVWDVIVCLGWDR